MRKRSPVALLAVVVVFLVSGFATGTTDADAAKRKRPDLDVTALSAPDRVTGGDGIDLVFTVKNKGRARAKRSVLRLLLSRDRQRSASDVKLGDRTIKRLKARRSSERAAIFKAPNLSGRFFVIACADATAKLREARERNNCRTSLSLQLTRKPDPPNPAAGSCGYSWAQIDANAGGQAPNYFSFGNLDANSDGLPVVGDWDGNGTDTAGIYVPSSGAWLLRNSNTSGPADISFTFGPGALPVAGDWDGDGADTVGIYSPTTGAWGLRNSNTTGVADISFIMTGPLNSTPLIGDWNGNGTDTIALRNGASFMLRNSNSAGPADITFDFGNAGDVGISGDWNGDTNDTVGVVASSGTWSLRNVNSAGPADVTFSFDRGGFSVVGDWNNDNIDTVGTVQGICSVS